MTIDLPPLNALRAFECAARHLNFTRAAEELCVTQAAVSHQVRNLEDYLGMKLFRRSHRQLVLTEDGQIFATTVRESLTQISNASRRLRADRGSACITVSLLPSFASRWLVPRLWGFRDRYPDIEVRLSAFEWLVDFERDGVDLAIRYGRGQWAGCESRLLMRERIFPVCSPDFLKRHGPVTNARDLLKLNLLHDDYARQDWSQWFEMAGLSGVSPSLGLRFSHTSLMLESAEEGQGVALAQEPLVQGELAKGRLVRLLDEAIDGDYSYWAVTPARGSLNPSVERFRDWLLQETNFADESMDNV